MSDSESEEVFDLSMPAVATKYTTVAEIVNKILPQVIEMCVPGADIFTICKAGDELLEAACAKVYNKKEKGVGIQKGVAFPTCISPNNFCGHVAPLKEDTFALKEGDLVKIDLGAHIDGFVAAVAHTILLPGGDEKDMARKADVMHAANTAAEAALRTVQVGKSNGEVTKFMNKAAEAFDCNMVQGVLSHEMKRHVIDGSNIIIAKEDKEEKVAAFEFGTNEVYCIDVLVSSGEGKPRETEVRTTVFKRDPNESFQLRTTKARQFLSEVGRRFPTMPFCLRSIEDETTAKVGISEALRHGLCDPYPVLKEKEGEFVAQYKFTVLLLPGGTKRVTGLPFVAPATEKTVSDEELKALLATSANPKKAKKRTKKPAEKENATDNA